MDNQKRSWSDYTYDLSTRQIEELLEIAARKDESITALVHQAIDEYIEREVYRCQR